MRPALDSLWDDDDDDFEGDADLIAATSPTHTPNNPTALAPSACDADLSIAPAYPMAYPGAPAPSNSPPACPPACPPANTTDEVASRPLVLIGEPLPSLLVLAEQSFSPRGWSADGAAAAHSPLPVTVPAPMIPPKELTAAPAPAPPSAEESGTVMETAEVLVECPQLPIVDRISIAPREGQLEGQLEDQLEGTEGPEALPAMDAADAAPGAVLCEYAPSAAASAPPLPMGMPRLDRSPMPQSASAPQLIGTLRDGKSDTSGAAIPAGAPGRSLLQPVSKPPAARRQRPPAAPPPPHRTVCEEEGPESHASLGRLCRRSKSEDKAKRRAVLHSGGGAALAPRQPLPGAEVHPTLGVCDVTSWVGNAGDRAPRATRDQHAAHALPIPQGRPADPWRGIHIAHLDPNGLLAMHGTDTSPRRRFKGTMADVAEPAWGHVRSLLLPSVRRPPTRSLFSGAHPQTPGYAPRDRAQGGGWGVEVVPVVLPRKSTGTLPPSTSFPSPLPSIPRALSKASRKSAALADHT